MINQEKRILLIGEDFDFAAKLKELCDTFCDEFVRYRFDSQALHSACSDSWDVLILSDTSDIKVTDICEVVKEVKPFIQILVLTGLKESAVVADYLVNGADDCVALPCNDAELRARVFASIRRSRKFRHHIAIANLNAGISQSTGISQNETDLASGRFTAEGYLLPAKDVIIAGDLKVFPSAKTATVRRNNLLLTQTEFLLLSYLIKAIGIPCSKEDLLRNVLGYDSDEYISSLHSHINRLRRKLEMAKSKTTRIETLWRYGYKLSVTSETAVQSVTSESEG